MRKAIFTTLLLVLSFYFKAEADTIRMMQYNLMYYTNSSGVADCNSTTNNLDTKDINLKTLLQYMKPDVFCVNEMGSNATYVSRLLTNTLNVDGVGYYASCPLTNLSGGTIANMMYYNTNKLAFHSHIFIPTSVRDINMYKMYYRAGGLSLGDTTFITFIIAHLKAGTTASDEQKRYNEIQALMNMLGQIGIADNYVVSGDFNLYTADEPAYQYLINNPNSLIQFYDPVDQEGDWHDNRNYAQYHTQSTHTNSTGCFATGGMDDRFDFILVSPYIYYGSQRVKSINTSYKSLGQDGNRFNGSLISPTNSSLPSNIINALYAISDHVPVMLEFEISGTSAVKEENPDFYANVVSPVQDDLDISIHLIHPATLTFDLYSVEGKHLEQFRKTFPQGYQHFNYEFPYRSSLYILKITDEKQQSVVKKIVKN